MARPPVPELKAEWVVDYGPTFAVHPAHQCAEASILNAVFALHGFTISNEVRNILRGQSAQAGVLDMRKLANLFDDIGSQVTRCQLQRCSIQAREEHEKNGGFGFLAEKASGVWIVRLHLSYKTNHVVVVDCEKRIIFDSEENYPVLLTADNLRLCAGPDGSAKARIEGYRPVIKV